MARVGTEIILLASMVVLARLIPPSAFGMFAVAILVQELAIIVPSEGVGGAIVQRHSIEREHLQGGMALSLLVGAVLCAVALLLSALLVQPLYGDTTAALVALTTPMFLLGAVLAVPMAVLRRRLDFRLLSLIELLQTMVRSVSAIVFAAALDLDGEALVLGGLAGVMTSVVFALAVARVPPPAWRSRAIRDLLPYGGPAALASVTWAGFRNGDYAIVGARLGAVQAGLYWRAFQLAVEYQRKISAAMTQMGFPVLARTENIDEMLLLRRRMVRLVTVAVFPALVLLVILAPVAVPWVFGPAWEPAVVPAQILAGAGAAALVIDQVGAVLMATGRSRAVLGYGVAHFAVYTCAVLVAANHGLAAVSIAAVVVHGIFLYVAYELMLRGRSERTLLFLWDDVSAACLACVGLALAAWPVDMVLDGLHAAPAIHIALVVMVAVSAYVVTLRTWFGGAWRDLTVLVRRVVPVSPVRAAMRRMPALAGRSG
jgi:O-antigen/teichoic acid export membrane protein